MELSTETRELLLHDFDAIAQYRISFSRMRLAALGASLTILGVVITLAADTPFPAILGSHAVVLLVVFASIRIIAALNRGIFVFSNHARWIEKQFGHMGFSTYWREYLKRCVRDSGSYAFVVAARVMNLIVSGYVMLSAGSVLLSQEVKVGWRVVAALVILAALVLFSMNEYHIRKDLDPRGFQDRLAQGLEQARAEASREQPSN